MTSISKATRELIYLKYEGHCAYCGIEIPYEKMQVDHINAKYLGGKDNIDNYNPSCRMCNFYKGTFTIEGFRKQLSTLHERTSKIFIVRLAIKYGILNYKKFDKEFYFEKYLTRKVMSESCEYKVMLNHLPPLFSTPDE